MDTAPKSCETRAGEDPGFTCWDGVSESSLGRALREPATECVEAELMEHGVRRTRQAATRPRLSLTMTTRSAYRHPVTKVFTEAMQARLHFSRDFRGRFRTALQEAVMNAMVHGNLGLDSQLRDGLVGVAASHAVIESLLARPAVARRAIRVDAIWNTTMLSVMVRDNGSGFARSESELPAAAPSEKHHGRGLFILETFCDRVALLHGGTTIKLGFRL
jgi:anti-sigma regulatory factor (Ser/Thr protein kinase)